MTRPRPLSFGVINGLLWRAHDALPRNEFLVTGALLTFCEIDEHTPADAVLECAPEASALAARSRLCRAKALATVDVLEGWQIVLRAGLVGHRRGYRLDLGALVRRVERPSSDRPSGERITVHGVDGNRLPGGRLTVYPVDGPAEQPSTAWTVTVHGVDGNRLPGGRLASLDARAHCPSSDPSLTLSAAAPPAPPPAPAHEGGGGGGGEGPVGGVTGREPLKPWVGGRTATDSDPPEVRVESLVNLFTELCGAPPRPGTRLAFERWMAEDRPLDVVRSAIRRAVEARLDELPAGARVRPESIMVGFLEAIMVRLRQDATDAPGLGGRARGGHSAGRRRGDRPSAFTGVGISAEHERDDGIDWGELPADAPPPTPPQPRRPHHG